MITNGEEQCAIRQAKLLIELYGTWNGVGHCGYLNRKLKRSTTMKEPTLNSMIEMDNAQGQIQFLADIQKLISENPNTKVTFWNDSDIFIYGYAWNQAEIKRVELLEVIENGEYFEFGKDDYIELQYDNFGDDYDAEKDYNKAKKEKQICVFLGT